jgi:Protein of unknown function (DUF4238)
MEFQLIEIRDISKSPISYPLLDGGHTPPRVDTIRVSPVYVSSMPYDHFVPKVYLKGWLTHPKSSKLDCYDKRTGCQCSKSIRRICGANDHDRLNYTGSPSLAASRLEVETRFHDIISMVNENRCDLLLYTLLSQFLALQLTTTPTHIEWVASHLATLRLSKIQGKHSQMVINFLHRVTHNPDVAKYSAATDVMSYILMVFQRSPWTIWTTNSPVFYTSDAPCIPYPFLISDVKYVVMPLTPQLCVKLDCRNEVDESFPPFPPGSIQFRLPSMSEVHRTNAAIFHCADRYVIKPSRGSFKKFAPMQNIGES